MALIDPFGSVTDLAAILSSRTNEDFHLGVGSMAKHLGFDRYAAAVGQDQPDGSTTFFGVHNAEAEYLSGTPTSTFHADPVSRHCRTSSLPIVWGEKTYRDAGQNDMYDFQKAYGYAFGIAIAYHLPRGRHFIIGFDRDQALPTDPVEQTRIISAFQLFSLYAQEAASVVLLPPQPLNAPHTIKALTQREIECMRWTVEGKTAWEVGMILNISESTANKFLKQAVEKLGCTSKMHAVAVALRTGII